MADVHMPHPAIDQIAQSIIRRRDERSPCYTLILYPGSSTPTQLGFEHLSNLVAHRFLSTILDLRDDLVLENSLARFLCFEDVKFLVRGEIPDERIATVLRHGKRVMVVKLCGDTLSRELFQPASYSLTGDLLQAVSESISGGCLLVGWPPQDPDILGDALMHDLGELYWIDPSSSAKAAPLEALRRCNAGKGPIAIGGADGNFDVFFSDLNMRLERYLVGEKAPEREAIELSIIEKQEKGSGYITFGSLSRMVDDFVVKIDASCSPDIVLFVNDPSAPGGMELKRRISGRFASRGIEVGTILIEGEGDSRTHRRQVKSDKPQYPSTGKTKTFLVLDAIAFSGNTLSLAAEKLTEWFPDDEVRTGVMIIDDSLLKGIRADAEHRLNGIIYQTITTRHEIFFPWGITHATSGCKRVFPGLDREYPIEISKRPWGTIEIFADQQYCSVRVLTIEADKTLSFQRHVCRDEFFVSMDENIGLEICGVDLKQPTSRMMFSDMPDIKAMVLEKGDYILIPKGIWHRFKASKERVRLLEIGFGLYDQNRDIERLDDAFGRTERDGQE